MQTERTIEDFCANEYKKFALYTIENRAIPSVIDGFKPTARKVAYIANEIWKTGNEKPQKVFQLSGQVAAKAFYHHGDASLSATIITMAQDFKNSMPIFEQDGQFGTLRSPEPGAPRYIGVKFNKNFRLLYKDFDLVENQYEEGEKIEPRFFLPIIPTVLLNGSSGIAVGFATNILNRNPLNLIEACLLTLKEKEIGQELLTPWIKGFSGKFIQDSDNKKSWVIFGRYEVKNTSTVQVDEIPPDYTYEKYENILNRLEEEGIISSYEDFSSGKVNYQIKFTRQSLDEYIKKQKLNAVLKLISKETENFTTLDEYGNLKIFNSAEEIIKYFVNFRLNFYQKRKDKIILNLETQIKQYNRRLKFIKDIISHKIEVNNIKKEIIVNRMIELEYEKENNSYDYLLNMPIHTLTEDRIIEIENNIQKKEDELTEIKKKTPKEMYVSDLNELKSAISKEYK